MSDDKNATEQELAQEAQERAEAAKQAEESGEESVEELKSRLDHAESEMVRALADLENAKKRLEREKEEYRKYAVEGVVSDLLPVLDNLELALCHGQNVDACKDLVMGVDMTRKVFLDVLSRYGLEPVGEVGDEFDPNWAEAVGVEENAEVAANCVANLMQRGYKLKDRVIRPAKVIISK
ncbi:nucleotide exchange factor GrpE [Desulfohalovibrio reitneri]|uniref:nucleotide exchange factor GrpE n=1 Tax=Desulfohalovibrio reitneri TaxID=1307759 RepID=UPI0004A74C8E|nr:nucleotide exchange factor GrpE [Desulfohalovibrio reitneri]